MDDQNSPFPQPDCFIEEVFEGIFDLRRTQTMKIEVSLYGKITPVQSLSKLGGDIAACSFHVFGRLGDNKSLTIFYQVIQVLHDLLFRFMDEMVRRVGQMVFLCMMFILYYRPDAFHGLPKDAFFVNRLGGFSRLRNRFFYGQRMQNPLIFKKFSQGPEGVIF